jgi:hypothetical protein
LGKIGFVFNNAVVKDFVVVVVVVVVVFVDSLVIVVVDGLGKC